MTKNWYASKGIWGGILMLVALVLQMTGIADITPDDQAALTDSIVNVSTVVAEVVGLVLSIWGRITARKAIGSGIPKANTMYELSMAVVLILMTVGYAIGWVNHVGKAEPAAPVDGNKSAQVEPSAGVIDLSLADGIYSAPHAQLDPADIPEL